MEKRIRFPADPSDFPAKKSLFLSRLRGMKNTPPFAAQEIAGRILEYYAFCRAVVHCSDGNFFHRIPMIS
jgi:hypothetical protein